MLTRRELLRRATAAAILARPAWTFGAPTPARRVAIRVFPQSVASGDPTPTGAIVWTRIAPEAAAKRLPIVLAVARDDAFRDVIVQETIPAERIVAEHDFTVRFDLDGRLAPDARFYYRFTHGPVSSPTGRLRTLPSADSTPAALRLGLASCQDFTRGHFNAYRDMAADDLDYVLHVGDFLYETVDPAKSLPDRSFRLPSGNTIARTLEDYREIHARVRSDAGLQSAFERHTLLTIWDDHEIANDRYWDPAAKRLRAPDHPLDGDPVASNAVHEAGIRAWSEYMPVRPTLDPAAPDPRDRIHLERTFRFGSLGEIFVSEARLRRDPHPCGEKFMGERFFKMEAKCPGRTAENRTMLGPEQRDRLIEAVARSNAQWKLWVTSVPLTPVGYGSGPGRMLLSLDTWAGYEHERSAILSAFQSRGIQNLVSLTGDLHTFFAGTLHPGEIDPLASSLPPAVGVEIATGAVSAGPLATYFPLLSESGVVLEHNPQLAYWRALENGYTRIEIDAREIRFEARAFAVKTATENAPPAVLCRGRVAVGSTKIETA